VERKREGDGGTPEGRFVLREVLYRADRLAAPATGLPIRPIAPDDGWCDAPEDAAYNRRVVLPHGASAEVLTREDGLYDLLAVIGFNDAPVRPEAGSAIFLHVAEGSGDDLRPTAGCVAVPLAALIEILALCGAETRIDIARS
jgi:L,D-peptidoglycan transpeptidase YkuD (ErfK/YbiS/YcfS/YnhG family)